MSKKRGRPKKPVEEKKPKKPTITITGEWENIDFGSCMRCKVERRLYSPLMLMGLKVCAPCSQVCATSSLPAEDEDEEEDSDNVWVRTMLSDLTNDTKS